MSLILLNSIRGGKVLQLDGYLYHLRLRHGEKSYWICKDRKCKSTVTLRNDTIEKKSSITHSHEAPSQEIERRNFLQRIRTRVVEEPKTPVSKIYKEEFAVAAKTLEDTMNLPSYASIETTMYNVRHRGKGSRPLKSGMIPAKRMVGDSKRSHQMQSDSSECQRMDDSKDSEDAPVFPIDLKNLKCEPANSYDPENSKDEPVFLIDYDNSKDEFILPIDHESSRAQMNESTYPVREQQCAVFSQKNESTYPVREQQCPAFSQMSESSCPVREQQCAVFPQMGESTCPVRDQCAVFGEHVANKIRQLDDYTRAITENKIMSILFEAEMSRFNPHLTITSTTNRSQL